MIDRRERRLLTLAAGFLTLYCIVLTLAPAVRERTWAVDYRLSQWLGLVLWLAVVLVTHRIVAQSLPGRDPLILPLAALLVGWGILTIWRLDAGLGARQSIWLVVSTTVCALALFLIRDLETLRRYKYALLAAGLLLTSLTLVLGTSPTASGPRLWLGCCGVYLQPSEPLKLLLVVYLAAYLADRTVMPDEFFPFLVPTLFVGGLALLLLIVQQDLGSASIFVVIYTVVIYLATGRRRVLIATASLLLIAGVVGYFWIGIVRTRLDSWIDPWADPSGSSYQIVQSLLAVASGGILGHGAGLGSPSLVPVAHSDFIFSALTEETGLLGGMALVLIIGLLLSRGIVAALRATDSFHRLLAAGLAGYLGVQSIVIIGGDLRLLPLTGITLPFVSYGGSSLLTAVLATGILLIISAPSRSRPTRVRTTLPALSLLGAALGAGIVAIVAAATWWTMVRGPDLLTRTDNPRRAISDRYVPRGDIVDRGNNPIDTNSGTRGSFLRVYQYGELGSVIGYTHPAYGQAGVEASLDGYLRGLEGNPTSLVWWNELLYGTPPPGVDVRLSIDLGVQKTVDSALGKRIGALILIDARSGEIVAMASHPTYDPNQLDAIGETLARDPKTPLLNRATQGMYLAGTATGPLVEAVGQGDHPTDSEISTAYRLLGFYRAPRVRLPTAQPGPEGRVTDLRLSPLQMALAASALSGGGVMPAPRLALAINTPRAGWVVLPPLDDPRSVLPAKAADAEAARLAARGESFWEYSRVVEDNNRRVTWYVAGTIPGWRGTPLALVLVLEDDDASAATLIGRIALRAATNQ